MRESFLVPLFLDSLILDAGFMTQQTSEHPFHELQLVSCNLFIPWYKCVKEREGVGERKEKRQIEERERKRGRDSEKREN